MTIRESAFFADDGTRLVFHEIGDGRPLILIHGYFSTAFVNWIRYGHAGLLAENGFRVIMPDLRGHGGSDKPHDVSAYPPDVLADDALALIRHLELIDYDLGGYSLGARTAVRMLTQTTHYPQRVILSGMGLQGLTNADSRNRYFRHVLTHLGAFERGTPEWRTEMFLNTVGGDPIALLNVLESFVNTPQAEIQAIEPPTLVLIGDQDDDNGSGRELADILPNSTYNTVSGNHMSVVARPELGRAILEFLT